MKAQQQDAIIVQLGKKGVTGEFLEQVAKHLHARKTVKIRILKSHLEEQGKDDAAKEIIRLLTEKMNVEHKRIGHTLIIRKKK